MLLLALVLALPAAASEPEILTRRRAAAPDLELLVEDYRVRIRGEHSYGTRMHALYRAPTVERLTDYVIVQFIRGCQFYSRPEGDPRQTGRILIRSHGKLIPYRFADWTIDSTDEDPSYASEPGEGRHDRYRWSAVPGSFAREHERFFSRGAPPRPELWISDRPGTAFHDQQTGTARNISVEFKTCLFEADQAVAGVGPERALACLEWASSWIYDHAKGRFETPAGIHPRCSEPLPAEASPPPAEPASPPES